MEINYSVKYRLYLNKIKRYQLIITINLLFIFHDQFIVIVALIIIYSEQTCPSKVFCPNVFFCFIQIFPNHKTCILNHIKQKKDEKTNFPNNFFAFLAPEQFSDGENSC